MKVLTSLLVFLLLYSCNTVKKQEQLPPAKNKINVPLSEDSKFPYSKVENTKTSHAKGFKITNYGNYKLLEVNNALPKQKHTHRYVLVTKEQAMVTTFNRDVHDAIITIPIERIAINKIEHNNFLKALNISNSVVENNALKNSGQLVSNGTNLIIYSGENGIIKELEHLKKANIPSIYTGEWNEKSKLAKEEWIKVFAALSMKEKEANLYLKKIIDSQKN